MEKRWIFIIVISITATILFFITNHRFQGYLRSEIYLGKELKSPPDSLDQYRLSSEAPFKYRLVFPSIVKATYHFVSDENNPRTFYHTYKFWSLFFYISSALSLFFLLLTLRFNENYSLAGTLTFLFLPPMLMAFTLPVHTREDTLAYTIFFVALTFLIKDKRWLFFLAAIAGVLTRETLLLLPLLYFFFVPDSSIIRKLFITGVPGVIWLSVRLFMPHEPYEVWEGLQWNLDNPEQVVGFLFITFNVCWIPFLMHMLFYKKSIAMAKPELLFFYRSALFTLLVILITTFLGGIYNEIRLLYLFFPWIVVIFLDFIRTNTGVFAALFQQKIYWIYATLSFALCAVLLYFVIVNREKLIVPGKWAVPYELWIILTVCYCFILLLFLPVSLRVFTLKKSAK